MRISLTAADGKRFRVERIDAAHPRGAVVILQEILGVTPYIRRVCQRYADAGYTAFAPSLFDRVEPDLNLTLSPEGIARGRALRQAVGWEQPLLDVAATVELARQVGPVGVVGFCWGGSIAWLAPRAAVVDSVIAYYGGQIPEFLPYCPPCPTLLHFGNQDPNIPLSAVERIGAQCPGVEAHIYDGGHAFDNDEREDHSPVSSTLAHARSLSHLEKSLSTTVGA